MIGNSSSILAVLTLILSFISLNKSQYTSVCSSMETNIDLKGNDLAFTYNANTPQQCSDLCSSLSKICTGYTFWMNTQINVCFLKNFTSTPIRYPAFGRKFFIIIF
jgi:hypothetical protein